MNMKFHFYTSNIPFIIMILLKIVLLKELNEASNKIPNLIWSYSEEDSSYEVMCVESWKKSNPDHLIKIFNKQDLDEFVESLKLKNFNPSHEIDPQDLLLIFMLDVMEKHGGTWIDITTFISKPIRYLRKYNEDKCIMYYTNNKEYLVLKTWLISTPPNNDFIVQWKKELLKSYEYQSVKEYIGNNLEKGTIVKIFGTPLQRKLITANAIYENFNNHLLIYDSLHGPKSYKNKGGTEEICSNTYDIIKLNKQEIQAIESKDKLFSCLNKSFENKILQLDMTAQFCGNICNTCNEKETLLCYECLPGHYLNLEGYCLPCQLEGNTEKKLNGNSLSSDNIWSYMIGLEGKQYTLENFLNEFKLVYKRMNVIQGNDLLNSNERIKFLLHKDNLIDINQIKNQVKNGEITTFDLTKWQTHLNIFFDISDNENIIGNRLILVMESFNLMHSDFMEQLKIILGRLPPDWDILNLICCEGEYTEVSSYLYKVNNNHCHYGYIMKNVSVVKKILPYFNSKEFIKFDEVLNDLYKEKLNGYMWWPSIVCRIAAHPTNLND